MCPHCHVSLENVQYLIFGIFEMSDSGSCCGIKVIRGN